MHIENDKKYVSCPECGMLLEKSSRSDSEIRCSKCGNYIAVKVENGKVITWKMDKIK